MMGFLDVVLGSSEARSAEPLEVAFPSIFFFFDCVGSYLQQQLNLRPPHCRAHSRPLDTRDFPPWHPL